MMRWISTGVQKREKLNIKMCSCAQVGTNTYSLGSKWLKVA